MHHSLRHDQTLFRDIGVFDPTCLPAPPRPPRCQELAFLIDPALRGGTPGNAVLRGPPGTGKTTTVRTVFAGVEEATRTIVPVYVNCRQNHTLLAVYRCIAGRLLGYTPPSRHLDDVREGIAARLRETDTILLVCLDDANYLIAAGTYNILLYQLLRLYERWDDIRGAGVFAVTSDLGLNLYAETDGPVRSVFHPTEVTFRSYAASEIRDILGDRIRQGLYPGVVPAGVLDLVARLTADAGDVGVGIDLVRAAACGLGERGAPPLPDRSSKRRGGVVKGCLTTLDALFSNDRVTVDTANHNAARIWKVYGTVARKGDNTPERSYRRAKVLSAPEDMAVVPMENLRQVAGLLPRQKAGIDLAAWLLSHGIAVRSTKPYLGAPSTPLRSARSQGRTRTGRLPSSLQTAPCMPAATMRPAAAGRSAGPNSGGCTSPGGRRKPPVRRRTPPGRAPPARPCNPHGRRPARLPARHVQQDPCRRQNRRRVPGPLGSLAVGREHERPPRRRLRQREEPRLRDLIPEGYKLTGTVSDKALYYADDLRPGTVFPFDDLSLPDDLQEVCDRELPRPDRAPDGDHRPAAPGPHHTGAVWLARHRHYREHVPMADHYHIIEGNITVVLDYFKGRQK